MKFKTVLLVYEPILVPSYDSDGNVCKYSHPVACPNSLDKLNDIRVKCSCSEMGLSANPDNVTGFRRLCDVINQNRNLPPQSMFASYGFDDLSILSQTTEALSKLKNSVKPSE